MTCHEAKDSYGAHLELFDTKYCRECVQGTSITLVFSIQKNSVSAGSVQGWGNFFLVCVVRGE